jgi:hypothetical protein
MNRAGPLRWQSYQNIPEVGIRVKQVGRGTLDQAHHCSGSFNITSSFPFMLLSR